MNITVIGCGRWGCFLAWYLDRLGHSVTLYGRKTSKRFRELQETRKNKYMTISESINLCSDLSKCAVNADYILISINAQNLRSLSKELSSYDLKETPLVLCMKGLEEETGRRLTEIVKEHIDTKIAVWAGPGHVEDFIGGISNCMVIDSENEDLKIALVEAFSSDLIRFYYGTDLIGTEIGAAAKNVIGIAAGMLDGLKHSSLKGALMSRGTREISRLIQAMGGNELSAYGLAHLGDYSATVFSKYSHNRKFGETFVLHNQYEDLAEGVPTSKAMMILSKKYSVELPICNAVYQIVHEDRDAEEMLNDLFMRSIKNEF
jgi:glycerol-3-phosphate dehydrogenase (NAD(P)+)